MSLLKYITSLECSSNLINSLRLNSLYIDYEVFSFDVSANNQVEASLVHINGNTGMYLVTANDDGVNTIFITGLPNSFPINIKLDNLKIFYWKE